MAWLTIAGIDVEVTDASEREPLLIGEDSRSFAGNLRTHYRAEKRIYEVGLLDMTKASLEALLTAVRGQHVAVSGDALAAPITARVRHAGSAYVHQGSGHKLVPTLVIEQV